MKAKSKLQYSVILSDQLASEFVGCSRVVLQMLTKHVKQQHAWWLYGWVARLQQLVEEGFPQVGGPVSLQLGLEPVSDCTCNEIQDSRS